MLSKEEQAKIGQLCQESSQAMEVCSLMNKQNQLQLSMVSHEIRNPVTLINSFLQLLGSSHPEITSYHYWTEITENMRFLRELLENLSAYNNSQKLSREEVSILSILKTVIADTEPTLSEKNINIQLKKDGAVPPFLMDRHRLRQVFLNLIRNSSEAIGESGGRITIHLTADLDQVTVRIQDSGPGIPEEFLDSLFDFFVTHKKNGTGLGLAISKNIVEAHGGTIEASAAEEGGAVFTICLPITYV